MSIWDVILLGMAYKSSWSVSKLCSHKSLVVTRCRWVLVTLGAVEAVSRHVELVGTETTNRQLISLLLPLLVISVEGMLSKDSASAKACRSLSSLISSHEMTRCAGSVNNGTWLTILHILFILRCMLICRELLESNWRHKVVNSVERLYLEMIHLALFHCLRLVVVVLLRHHMFLMVLALGSLVRIGTRLVAVRIDCLGSGRVFNRGERLCTVIEEANHGILRLIVVSTTCVLRGLGRPLHAKVMILWEGGLELSMSRQIVGHGIHEVHHLLGQHDWLWAVHM